MVGTMARAKRRTVDFAQQPCGFMPGDANLYRYVRNNPTNATDPSGLIEVDDNPDDPNIKKLTDANAVVNDILTATIREAKKQFPKDANAGLAYIYDKLAAEGLTSAQTRFEQDVEAKLEKGKTKWRIPLDDSRYSKVPINDEVPDPKNWAKYPLMWRNKNAVIGGLADVIKISGVPIGTDKLGHFIQQGYWYFKLSQQEKFAADSEEGKEFRTSLGIYMEGGPASDRLPLPVKEKLQKLISGIYKPNVLSPFQDNPPGFFGWIASGVHSNADRVANEAGFWFYQRLYDSWANIDTDKYQFDIAALLKDNKIDINMLNEYKNPNQYNPYVAADVAGPKAK